jgi:hypothetical protein
VISLPDRDEAVAKAVNQVWQNFLEFVETMEDFQSERRKKPPVKAALEGLTDAEVFTEIQVRGGAVGAAKSVKQAELDTLVASKEEIGNDQPDGGFYARLLPKAMWDAPWMKSIDRVILVHRLREVMAEDFGAKPHSSQVACLQGVRDSDIYIGVLGQRYGFVTQSGKSVTEEEFDEARRRGRPVLVFVQNVQRDPDQQRFFDRIGNYEEGFFVKFFENPQELQTKITTSLHDLAGDPGVLTLDAAGAQKQIQRYVIEDARGSDALISVIVLPARQGQEYLSPLTMGEKQFKDKLMQQAMFGSGAILQPERGYEVVEAREHMRIEQTGQYQQPAAAIEVHADGTLVWQATLGDDEDNRKPFSLIRQFVINQQEVERRLAGFWAFAASFYDQLDDSPTISTLYASVIMQNIQQKYMGIWPSDEPSGMSVPMDQIDDPLFVPAQPMKVARAELGNPGDLARKFMGLMLRAFRATAREYKHNTHRW